ncbi:MAG: hypothetical protein AAF409_15460, partial [Pseudomonadota bacterium]
AWFRMKAFWASVNLLAFIALSSLSGIGHTYRIFQLQTAQFSGNRARSTTNVGSRNAGSNQTLH